MFKMGLILAGVGYSAPVSVGHFQMKGSTALILKCVSSSL